ncbi:glycosyltransferase [Gammaproteobacteria bacterium LSUCC0112]|nr:glycosyltransferase [Gammaproteobacteria bacterium LSUCC0112]
MRVSVVLSTYNSPAWLEKVLIGYCCQSTQDFEMIIADDGSREETAQLIQRMQRVAPFPIKHVWQRDDGFRKCRILNKAVLHAESPYLIFSDGDCIPRADFVATHLRKAQPGCYLSGSYYKLPMSTSHAISHEDIKSGRCFDKKWLYTHGLPRTRKTLKISASPFWAAVLNRLTPTRCNLKGSNASVWREDVLRVNGFDERMPWGGEDREFGVRLINAGIKPVHVRYDAICIHLDHTRGYVDPVRVKANKTLRLYNEKHRVMTTDHGIQQLIDAGYSAQFQLKTV